MPGWTRQYFLRSCFQEIALVSISISGSIPSASLSVTRIERTSARASGPVKDALKPTMPCTRKVLLGFARCRIRSSYLSTSCLDVLAQFYTWYRSALGALIRAIAPTSTRIIVFERSSILAVELGPYIHAPVPMVAFSDSSLQPHCQSRHCGAAFAIIVCRQCFLAISVALLPGLTSRFRLWSKRPKLCLQGPNSGLSGVTCTMSTLAAAQRISEAG